MVKEQATINDLKKATENYITELKRLPADESQKRARNNLQKIGVLDNKGNMKSQIVEGDFFGW